MRVKRLISNARLAASTILTHLNDDPVLLVIQISQRLPCGFVRHVASSAAKASAVRWVHLPVVEALAAHLLGRHTAVQAILVQAASGRINRRTARRLGEIGLAAGMVKETDGLLFRVGSGVETAGLRARRRWYDGDMAGAVDILHTAGRRRHAERLAGELRVFKGWTPTLAGVGHYEPTENTVLHLLTNSLPYTGSGYAQRTHSLLKAQAEAGWIVHAATRIGYPVQVGKIFAASVDVLDGVSYHRLLPVPMNRGFDQRLQQQAEELLDLAVHLRPAVLHGTTPFTNAVVIEQVAHALGIPWVYEVRGQLADTWASNRPAHVKASERYKLFTDREAQVMRQASLVVTLGEAMKQGITRSGVPKENILLSPNAVGDEYLKEPLSSREVRQQLGLPQDGVFIGTVSSLVDYEGLDSLVRAVALLAPRYPELQGLIVGDGAAGPSLKSLALDLGVASRVTFTGRVPRHEARSYHQALDIFVVPRKNLDVTSAVTPLKPVEAMACDRPVVASDLPALREIVTDGVTGLLVEPGDLAKLTEAIEYLVQNQVERTSFGAKGRATALATRTWARNAIQLSDAYRRLEHSS